MDIENKTTSLIPQWARNTNSFLNDGTGILSDGAAAVRKLLNKTEEVVSLALDQQQQRILSELNKDA